MELYETLLPYAYQILAVVVISVFLSLKLNKWLKQSSNSQSESDILFNHLKTILEDNNRKWERRTYGGYLCAIQSSGVEINLYNNGHKIDNKSINDILSNSQGRKLTKLANQIIVEMDNADKQEKLKDVLATTNEILTKRDQ